WQRGTDVEVRDLSRRVDPGVGAPRPVQLEVLAAGDGAYRTIDLTLDGFGVLLNLPAAIAGPSVFDRQLESRHATTLAQPENRRDAEDVEEVSGHDAGQERALRHLQHVARQLLHSAARRPTRASRPTPAFGESEDRGSPGVDRSSAISLSGQIYNARFL